MYIPKPNPMDLIPVDIVSNGLLVATAFHGSQKETQRLAVYNCSSGSQNGITMEGFKDIGVE